MMKIIAFVILFIAGTNQTARAICVKAKEANLRQGPGTQYEKVWKVYKYMPFRTLSRSGDWVQVRDVDGGTQWIHKSLVTNDYLCVVVKVKKVNLRSGPGTNFSKVVKAYRLDVFKFIKQEGQWINVMDVHGDTFWIFRNLVWVN